MMLMKSSFGHMFMVMGGWGTALYLRDESMRYRGDPSGERLTHSRGEISAGTQEQGEGAHQRALTCARKGCP
jgi:hypothetical protein